MSFVGWTTKFGFLNAYETGRDATCYGYISKSMVVVTYSYIARSIGAFTWLQTSYGTKVIWGTVVMALPLLSSHHL